MLAGWAATSTAEAHISREAGRKARTRIFDQDPPRLTRWPNDRSSALSAVPRAARGIQSPAHLQLISESTDSQRIHARQADNDFGP